MSNRRNNYEENYNYIKRHITTRNYQLIYEDILKNVLQNQFTQSIEYDFNNNDRNLIKENITIDSSANEQEQPLILNNAINVNNTKNTKLLNIIDSNTPNIQSQSYSSSCFTLFDQKYEVYNLHSKLQNNLCAAILFVISDLFRILTLKEQQNYIKTLKYKMYIELSEKDLYHKFNYHKKRLKKNDLETQLMNYEILNVIGQKYLMDYFNLNIILYDFESKSIAPYLQYNSQKNNIIIGYRKTTPIQFCPILNNSKEDSIFETFPNETLSEEKSFNPFANDKLKGISSYKLKDLQDKCTTLQISIMKVVGSKEKKKTKKDLYDDLLTILTKK